MTVMTSGFATIAGPVMAAFIYMGVSSGKLFIPFVFMMGVPWSECETVSQLVGVKTVVNEFFAYQKLSHFIKEGSLSQRSITIATYALCGFANPEGIGITLATFGALCPKRRSDVSELVLRSFVAGTMACFMTACIAGALISDQ